MHHPFHVVFRLQDFGGQVRHADGPIDTAKEKNMGRILIDRLSTNRWAIALAGMVAMMTLGTVYSWSLFTQPLIAAFGWSNTTTTWAFAIAIFFIGVGAIVGGRWQDRFGPRRVMLIGVGLWSAANILTGIGTPTFGPAWLYLTYGIMGGFGVGVGYITPVATVIKWFRDRRGLAGGMVVTGFGLGAVIYNMVVKSVPAFAATATAAADYVKARAAASAGHDMAAAGYHGLTQENVQVLMNVFIASGVVFALLGGLSALLLRNPPQRRAIDNETIADGDVSYTTREMLCTPQFYHLWLMMFVNVLAGILVIGNALPIIQELTGVSPQIAAATYAGTALFNAAGRFFWGMTSDRIGRRPTLALIFGIQALVFLLLSNLHSVPAVACAFAIVLLCLGGGFGTMPSFNADYFGTRHMGANYGVILSAWGCAGLIGPPFAAWIKDVSGSFSGALIPVPILLMAAIVLPLITRKPGASGKAAAAPPTELDTICRRDDPFLVPAAR